MKNKLLRLRLRIGLFLISPAIVASDYQIYEQTSDVENRFISLAQRTYHQCKRTIQKLQKLPPEDEHIALFGVAAAAALILRLNVGSSAANTDSFGPVIVHDNFGNIIETQQIPVPPQDKDVCGFHAAFNAKNLWQGPKGLDAINNRRELQSFIQSSHQRVRKAAEDATLDMYYARLQESDIYEGLRVEKQQPKLMLEDCSDEQRTNILEELAVLAKLALLKPYLNESTTYISSGKQTYNALTPEQRKQVLDELSQHADIYQNVASASNPPLYPYEKFRTSNYTTIEHELERCDIESLIPKKEQTIICSTLTEFTDKLDKETVKTQILTSPRTVFIVMRNPKEEKRLSQEDLQSLDEQPFDDKVTKVNKDGHWYCFVINNKWNPETKKYHRVITIADSLNHSRCKDYFIQAFIAHLQNAPQITPQA